MTTAIRRGRGVAAGLSADAVVAAATVVAARVGFSGMSLRAVAAELDVSATALYHHVAGKEELVDAVADAFVARLLDAPLPPEPLTRVRDMAHRLRLAGLEHPGLLSAIVGHVPHDVPSAQSGYAETLLDALADAGASEQLAVLLYSIIVRLCLGEVVAEANLRAPSRRPIEERVRAHAEQTEFPRTARMMAGSLEGEHRSFDAQLDVVLSALG